MPGPNFIIKPENVNLYELESNDRFNIDALPEDEQKKIASQNEEFERKTLYPAILEKAQPCQCRMDVMVERAKRRASLLPNMIGPNGQLQVQVEQDDVDQKDFTVILNEDDGYYNQIRLIISHCKNCGELHFWGDLAPVGDMLAKAFVDYDTTMHNKEKREAAFAEFLGGASPSEFVLEDVETGETTPADDVVKMLTGQPENTQGD